MHIPLYMIVDNRADRVVLRTEDRAELEGYLARQADKLSAAPGVCEANLTVYEVRQLPPFRVERQVRVIVDYD